MSASAQVALTAATRRHLGLCIFCGLNARIHCAGAGISPDIIQRVSPSCTVSLVTIRNAVMSQSPAFSFLFQTGALQPLAPWQSNTHHFTAVGQRAKEVAVTSCICQEEPGMVL